MNQERRLADLVREAARRVRERMPAHTSLHDFKSEVARELRVPPHDIQEARILGIFLKEARAEETKERSSSAKTTQAAFAPGDRDMSNEQPAAKAKLSPEEFILLAIETLADPKYKNWVHTVFSNFNAAFREYFKEEGYNPVKWTTKLHEEGKIALRPSKKGVIISLPREGGVLPSTEAVLKKMGLK